MRIRRIKGSGVVSTFLFAFPRPIGSWHVKTRLRGDNELLSCERANLKRVRNLVPTTQTAGLVRLGPLRALITKTIPGVPGHRLIATLSPPEVVLAHDRALRQLKMIPLEHVTSWLPMSAPLREPSLHAIRGRLRFLHPDHVHQAPEHLLRVLEVGSGESEVSPVVVHGDFCPPNLIFSTSGTLRGIIDVGEMRIGPPTFDLAIVSWIIDAILGPRWGDLLLAGHGLTRSSRLIRFHRLAYDLALRGDDPWSWIDGKALVERRERLASEPLDRLSRE